MSLRHLYNWSELSTEVWDRCLARAGEHRRNRAWNETARGKALGLLFFNPSLRTRISMELAAAHLGAVPTVLTPGQGTWNLEWRDGIRMDADKAEHVREAIGVLARYVDALGVRTFASLTDRQADREDAAFRAVMDASTVPVINLESALWHPCQALADAATMQEHFQGEVQRRRFVLSWAPHPNPLPRAVPNSALLMAARSGMEIVVARPEGFELDANIMRLAAETAARHGGSVNATTEQGDALAGAHVVYAKAWSGDLVYDDRAAEAARRTDLDAWRLTQRKMEGTDHGAFMHCLPVRREVVVDGEVLDSPAAIHLLQAEYHLHAQKAILEWVWDLN
ncbi:N-acetylornithine carbamoyltransferase [soil metagenome]